MDDVSLLYHPQGFELWGDLNMSNLFPLKNIPSFMASWCTKHLTDNINIFQVQNCMNKNSE